MVSDGAFLVLAGLTSWGADPCATANVPGVYTRLGAPALNGWVRDRVPMARASASDSTVDPGDEVTFSVTANHPGSPAYFTDFAWDFDSDGTADGSGASLTHAYPQDGAYIARVVASGAGHHPHHRPAAGPPRALQHPRRLRHHGAARQAPPSSRCSAGAAGSEARALASAAAARDAWSSR